MMYCHVWRLRYALNAAEKELLQLLGRKFPDTEKSHADKVKLTLSKVAISVHSRQHRPSGLLITMPHFLPLQIAERLRRVPQSQ